MAYTRIQCSMAAALVFGAVGCGGPEPDFHGEEAQVDTAVQAISVAEAVNSGCSTTAVWGLSMQIIEQMNCLIPSGAMAEVPPRPNFAKGGATLAWMQPPAVSALVGALDDMPGTTLTSNSMLRTVAQQYLLYRWYQNGSCGISLAATPGTSNHESGLAVDVSEHGTWQSTLEAHGFSWLGSSDPVHFDFAGAGTIDLGGKDVLAFQQLWNLNNPSDTITEDGDYGADTGDRLAQSPAEGFAIPPSCGAAGSGGTGGTSGAPSVGGSGGSSGDGGNGALAGAGGSAEGGTAGNGETGVGGSPGDSSGCGCRTAPARDAGTPLSLGALLFVFAMSRRRATRSRRP